jgi:deoxyribonuclease-4
MAVFRSANAGLHAVQIFTAIPKFYGDKSSIRPDRVEKFRAALEQTGMKPEHVIVHAAYVLSVATADPQMWARAAAGLAKEMELDGARDRAGVLSSGLGERWRSSCRGRACRARNGRRAGAGS